MSVGRILKKGLEIIRKDPVIIAPSILVSIASGLLSVLVIGGHAAITGPGEMDEIGGRVAGPMYVKSFMAIVGWILHSFAQGMVVSMVVEVEDKGRTSLGHGFSSAKKRAGSLLFAGFAVGILIMIGFMLFFIPGILVAYIFLFTFVIIMLEESSPIDAMKRSVQVVRSNLSYTFALFASIIGVGLLAVVVNILFRVSIIGLLVGMAVSGVYMAYTGVVALKAYQELGKKV